MQYTIKLYYYNNKNNCQNRFKNKQLTLHKYSAHLAGAERGCKF